MADNLVLGSETFTSSGMKPRSDEEINADYLGKLAANTAVCMMNRAVFVLAEIINPGESRFFDRQFVYEDRYVLLFLTKIQNPGTDPGKILYFSEKAGTPPLDTYIEYGGDFDTIIRLMQITSSLTELEAWGTPAFDPLYIRSVTDGGFEIQMLETDTEELRINLVIIVVG